MKDSPSDLKKRSAALRIRKIGNALGFILPKWMAARLKLKEGDKLFPTEQLGGGLLLTSHDPDFQKAMEVARHGMRRYRNALAELAK